jgi:FAD/FMN-containing dehydrogenase
MDDLIDQLRRLVGENGIISGPDLAQRAVSYWDPSPTEAKVLVRPETTQQVSDVLCVCHERGQAVVVQGGLTGVVEGALASPDEVIISLERMNVIESVDAMDGVAVIQAGAVLQSVQEQLKDQGFLFPLDLGARGSCTIGGNVATNAGGMNVLRFGMIRNLVLGLEVVLADGTILTSMNQMLKNNTGYDLKQLFIGSEGTLGVVTRVVIKLFPLPASRQTALLATESFDSVVNVLKTLQSDLAGTLSAYEVMWNNYFSAVTVEGAHRSPLSRDYPYYLLVEAEGANSDSDGQRFQETLEKILEAGDVVDAVVPKSDTERDALWAIREDFEAALPAYLYDISLPIKSMTTYVDRLEQAFSEWRSDAECLVFGHIADGNLHLFVTPFDEGIHHQQCNEIVYGCLEDLGGSISAEHGIGLNKKAWLGSTRSEDEINIMRGLKNLLDPTNLLNPGKVFDDPPDLISD